jgi:hypothetical protein
MDVKSSKFNTIKVVIVNRLWMFLQRVNIIEQICDHYDLYLCYISKNKPPLVMKVKLSLVLMLLPFIIFGQQHRCGTHSHDMEKAENLFSKAGYLKDLNSRRGEIKYIPVKLHVVSDNLGGNKAGMQGVLNQFARLNSDFKNLNLVFYLVDGSGFNFIKDNAINSNPRANEADMKSYKHPNAVNIFFTSKIIIPGSEGTILGYYSPTNDFVTIINSEVEGNTNTISHEVGHFFNLRHTFHGWEANPYTENEHGNPVALDFAPETNVRVELVNKSNCTIAADQLCDTPPDYNFGFSVPGCTWTKTILDRNSDTIKPMANNQMSYFNNCSSFVFTLDQENRMRANLSNFLRSNLERNYIPNTKTLPVSSELISPQNSQKIDSYNSVTFEWKDQGAEYYMLEVRNSAEAYVYFVKGQTKYTAKNLLANKLYVWSVRAFNDGFANNNISNTSRTLRTGSIQVGINDIIELSKYKIYPNPATIDQINIELELDTPLEAYLLLRDLSGKILYTKNENLIIGRSNISLDISTFADGFYFFEMVTAKGRLVEKILIQK